MFAPSLLSARSASLLTSSTSASSSLRPLARSTPSSSLLLSSSLSSSLSLSSSSSRRLLSTRAVGTPGTFQLDRKDDAQSLLLDAKQRRGLTFAELGAACGHDEVFVASAVYGQNSLSDDAATRLVDALAIDDAATRASAVASLTACPLKSGLGETVPSDPLIYRLHEITQCYGHAIKAVVHEKFGDGIMSAVDFDMHVEREPERAPGKGDRVRITMSGKFLKFASW